MFQLDTCYGQEFLNYHSQTLELVIGGSTGKIEIDHPAKEINLLVTTPSRPLDHIQNTKRIHIQQIEGKLWVFHTLVHAFQLVAACSCLIVHIGKKILLYSLIILLGDCYSKIFFSV